jgi:hypothetical protein
MIFSDNRLPLFRIMLKRPVNVIRYKQNRPVRKGLNRSPSSAGIAFLPILRGGCSPFGRE